MRKKENIYITMLLTIMLFIWFRLENMSYILLCNTVFEAKLTRHKKNITLLKSILLYKVIYFQLQNIFLLKPILEKHQSNRIKKVKPYYLELFKCSQYLYILG